MAMFNAKQKNQEESDLFGDSTVIKVNGAPKVTSTPLHARSFNRGTNSPSVSLRAGTPRRYSLSEITQTPSIATKQSQSRTNSPALLIPLSLRDNVSLYEEAKSSGLARRIVQYNEEAEEECHVTHQKRYNSPGLFPVVHLFKKSPPKLEPCVRQVKIKLASPEHLRRSSPSVYKSKMLESIDRPRLKRQLSLSSPHHNNDQETKSVLDALKEISRKRIHANEVAEYPEECGKRQKLAVETVSNKRNRTELSPGLESPSSSPPLKQLKKRVCLYDELTASKSSSDGTFLKARALLAKRKTTSTSTESLVEPPKQCKIVANVETQTPPEEKEEEPPIELTENKNDSGKEEEEEVTTSKHRTNAPIKVFDDAPLERIRKARLAALMGKLIGKEINWPEVQRPPKEEEEKPVQPLVSILSTKDSVTTVEKHVHFNVPVTVSAPSATTTLGAALVTESAPKPISESIKVSAPLTFSTPPSSTSQISTPATLDTNKSPSKMGGFKFDLKATAAVNNQNPPLATTAPPTFTLPSAPTQSFDFKTTSKDEAIKQTSKFALNTTPKPSTNEFKMPSSSNGSFTLSSTPVKTGGGSFAAGGGTSTATGSGGFALPSLTTVASFPLSAPSVNSSTSFGQTALTTSFGLPTPTSFGLSGPSTTTTGGGFALSTPPTTTTSSFALSAPPTTTSGGFALTAPSTSTSGGFALTAPSTTIGFTLPLPVTTTATGGGFTMSTPTASVTTCTAPPQFNFSQKPTFAFGGAPPPTTTTAAVSKPPSLFDVKSSFSTPSAFGSSTAPKPASIVFGNSSATTTAPSIFGMTANTTTAAAPPPTTSVFAGGFGSANTNKATPPPSFGAVNSQSSAFGGGFGGSGNNSTQVAGFGGGFGSSTATTTAPSFGGFTNTAPTPAFGFGGGAKPAASTNVFGGAGSSTTPAVNSFGAASSGFGSATSSFGSAVQSGVAKPTFSFGNSEKLQQNPNFNLGNGASAAFSKPANTSAAFGPTGGFGASTAASSSFSFNSNTPAAPFSFGTGKAAAEIPKPSFNFTTGAAAANLPPPPFGNAAAPAFGAASSSTPFGGGFGAPQAAAAGGIFNIGSGPTSRPRAQVRAKRRT